MSIFTRHAAVLPNRMDLHKFWIGADALLDQFNADFSGIGFQGNYPPYNIVQVSDTVYHLELAVSGFGTSDITVTKDKDSLIVTGEKADKVEKKYLHQGLSSRRFRREWKLPEYNEITSAKIENGVLTVVVERQVPEEQKPKTIKVEVV